MSFTQVHTRRFITTAVGVSLLLAAILLLAETAPPPTGGLNLSATTANVSGAPDSVRFEILRWSTDDERDQLVAAWELRQAPAAAGKAGATKGNAGKGAAKGAGAPPKLSPEASLASAVQRATTIGYLWSSENAGYALRYAGRFPNADGSQKIILITQRRLGAVNQLWNPAAEGSANTLEFSVIELRLNARGEGEGKASLSGKLVPDAAAKVVTLENYDASPTVFHLARIQAAKPTVGKR